MLEELKELEKLLVDINNKTQKVSVLLDKVTSYYEIHLKLTKEELELMSRVNYLGSKISEQWE